MRALTIQKIKSQKRVPKKPNLFLWKGKGNRQISDKFVQERKKENA